MPFLAISFYNAEKKKFKAMLGSHENKISIILIGLSYVPNNQGKEPDRPILEINQGSTMLSGVVFKR